MASRKSLVVYISVALLLFDTITVPVAHATTNTSPQGVIKHVIVVIQENRTPDDLFYLIPDTTPPSKNVHTASGLCTQGTNSNVPVSLVSYPLDNPCFSPKHEHSEWLKMFDVPNGGGPGRMDGACNIDIKWYGTCKTSKPNALKCPNPLTGYCAQYTYAENTVYDGTNGILDPLFEIANKYGFANWMFQTNQGPSFAAHQFLLSGTSAPALYSPTDDFYKWFAADNPSGRPDIGNPAGCSAAFGVYARTVDPSGSQGGTCPSSGVGNNYCYYPCYNHPTLPTDVLDIQGQPITWAYYSPGEKSLWTAPNAIQNICGPPHSASCSLTEWTTNVSPYFRIKNPPEYAPILRDIKDCSLKSVSWVVPDGHWSDHPGYDPAQNPGPHNGGPSYLASIVNAIGNSWNDSKIGGQNHQCDYWGGNTTDPDKNQPTVILIVWDDWGGFYDHVSPDASAGGPGIGYPGTGSGGSQYVYGFRVPLLVVSAFAKPSFVDGPMSNPVCSPLGFSSPYCHDFGSILNFIEYSFGSGGSYLSEIDPPYHYADHWAPDAFPQCPVSQCPYSLSDFFGDFNQPQPFNPIKQGKYDASCFDDPTPTSCFGSNFAADDPDDDADETQ